MPRYIELRAPDGSTVLLNAEAVSRVQAAQGGCNIDDAYYKNSYAEIRELLAPDLVEAEARAREARAREAQAHEAKEAKVAHAEQAHEAKVAHAEEAHATKGHATKGHSDR